MRRLNASGSWMIGSLRTSAFNCPRDCRAASSDFSSLPWAMAGTPPILILDEPMNELAPQRRRHVSETLRAENQVRGTTIIFDTHDAIEAEKIIQRVGIMRSRPTGGARESADYSSGNSIPNCGWSCGFRHIRPPTCLPMLTAWSLLRGTGWRDSTVHKSRRCSQR